MGGSALCRPSLTLLSPDSAGRGTRHTARLTPSPTPPCTAAPGGYAKRCALASLTTLCARAGGGAPSLENGDRLLLLRRCCGSPWCSPTRKICSLIVCRWNDPPPPSTWPDPVGESPRVCAGTIFAHGMGAVGSLQAYPNTGAGTSARRCWHECEKRSAQAVEIGGEKRCGLPTMEKRSKRSTRFLTPGRALGSCAQHCMIICRHVASRRCTKHARGNKSRASSYSMLS